MPIRQAESSSNCLQAIFITDSHSIFGDRTRVERATSSDLTFVVDDQIPILLESEAVTPDSGEGVALEPERVPSRGSLENLPLHPFYGKSFLIKSRLRFLRA